jgi:Na+-driven multidrug efflux pump
MPIIGISQGFATLVSFNYGAKKLARVKKILAEAILWSIVIAGPGFLIIMFFPEYLLRLFTSDTDLIIMGMNPIRIVVLLLPIVGLQILGGSFFQAIGRAVPALLITISRQLLLLIPALLIMPVFLGLLGVWLAIPVSDFVSVIITSAFILKEIRTFNRKLETSMS